VVDGRRFVDPIEAPSSLLVEGARFVRWVPENNRFMCPRDETVFLRGPDGRDVAIRQVDDVRPYLRPIDSRERALKYADVLRALPIPPSVAPGLGRGSPETWGINPEILAGHLRDLGIDPASQFADLPDGFEITRLVVVPGTPASVVRVRERVGRDGRYSATVLETVKSGPEVDGWIWRAS
jgi:hypothetical protein